MSSQQLSSLSARSKDNWICRSKNKRIYEIKQLFITVDKQSNKLTLIILYISWCPSLCVARLVNILCEKKVSDHVTEKIQQNVS